VASAKPLADFGHVEGDLGHQDLRRTAGDPSVGGDPTGVTAHHLAHDDAVVRLGRGAQPVDGIGGRLHGGIEPESDVGAHEVVVDGLGHPDHPHAVAAELGRHTERVLAPDGHDHLDAVFGKGGQHPLCTIGVGERIGA